MRCPKCGYNSFDHLDSCKKCGKDLTEHKSKFGIKTILLSGFTSAKEEPVEVEEVVDTVVETAAETEPEVDEITPEPVAEQPVTESASEDFGFNFMDESSEDEDLAFDELFEETPLEEEIEEPLPAPAETVEDEPEETLLDDNLELDLGEPDDLATDFGLDESATLEEDLSSATELGLDDSDFASFDEDDELGTKEDPKRPFDREESLESEEAPTSSPTDSIEEQTGPVPAEPELLQKDPFGSDEDLGLDVIIEMEEPSEESDLGSEPESLSEDLVEPDVASSLEEPSHAIEFPEPTPPPLEISAKEGDDPFGADEDLALDVLLEVEESSEEPALEPEPESFSKVPVEPAANSSLEEPSPTVEEAETAPAPLEISATEENDPFGADEDLPLDVAPDTEESAEEISPLPSFAPPSEQEPIQDDPFIADDGFQEELFSDDDNLLPLPDTNAEDQPLESLETSFGEKSFDSPPIGASDDFTLGALPTTEAKEPPDAIDEETEEGPAPQQEEGEPTDSAEKEEAVPKDDASGEKVDAISPPFGRRVSAFLCDMALLGLVGLCFIIVAETALSENTEGLFPSLKTMIDLSIPYFLVVFCLTFGYFTLFHFLAGQTPGKMVANMRVETCSGEDLAFSQAFMRSVGGLVQLLPAGLGYLSVILHKEGRGWNDRLAGTQLVDLKNLPDEEDEIEESEEPDEE